MNPHEFPSSIPEIEEDTTSDFGTGRELHVFVISAKRYALFTQDPTGRLELLHGRAAAHGLGHLLSPLGRRGKEWIEEVWEQLPLWELAGAC